MPDLIRHPVNPGTALPWIPAFAGMITGAIELLFSCFVGVTPSA
jgi:hypothetical protein